jgi:hypothetical protein
MDDFGFLDSVFSLLLKKCLIECLVLVFLQMTPLVISTFISFFHILSLFYYFFLYPLSFLFSFTIPFAASFRISVPRASQFVFVPQTLAVNSLISTSLCLGPSVLAVGGR